MGRWSSGNRGGGNGNSGSGGGDDGWTTVSRRSASRGQRRGGGGGGGGGYGNSNTGVNTQGGGNRGGGGGGGVGRDDLQRENDRLRAQLAAAERRSNAATDRTPHPLAREQHRDGDWQCVTCWFTSNRHERGFCYRCAAPRHLSHGPAQPLAQAAGAPGAASAAATAAASPTPPTSIPPSSSSPPPSGTDRIKILRQKKASLEAAKAALAGCDGCEEERARLDADVAKVQSDLAQVLPIEVAVKGTITTTAQARAAVIRAEGKVDKLERQIAALVSQYDAAAQDLSASRAKLAEAEAATARAASSGLQTSDIIAALATDPGPIWAAVKAAISARCPAASPQVVLHVDAATKAFEAALKLIPDSPVGQQAPQPPVAAQPSVPPVPLPQHLPQPSPQPPPAQGCQQSAPPSAAAAAASAVPAVQSQQFSPIGCIGSAEDAVAAAWHLSQQQAVPQQQAAQPAVVGGQPSAELAGQGAAAAAASAAASGSQVQQVHLTVQPLAEGEAGRQHLETGIASSVAASAASAIAAAATPVPNCGGANAQSAEAEDLEFSDASDGPTRDDAMGGGADDQVARKRALESAHQIANKFRAGAKPAASA